MHKSERLKHITQDVSSWYKHKMENRNFKEVIESLSKTLKTKQKKLDKTKETKQIFKLQRNEFKSEVSHLRKLIKQMTRRHDLLNDDLGKFKYKVWNILTYLGLTNIYPLRF